MAARHWRTEVIAAEKEYRINAQITAPKVRLIDADGGQAGIVDLADALKRADEAELDLVEIASQADPPVCRIMDHGKHLFELQKKRQAARRKQKQIQVKEVKFRPGTDIGDYNVKLRNLRRFLAEGDKAKVTLRFRGREMAHQELGLHLLKRVESDLADIGIVEQFPRMEGRLMTMVVAPRKSA